MTERVKLSKKMEFTRDQRAEALDNLPEGTRDFILSEEFSDVLRQLGKSNNLLLDKITILGDEIYLVILGLKKVSDLVENVKQRLNLTQQSAGMLGNEINELIFKRIREILKGGALQIEHNEKDGILDPNDRESILAEIEDPIPAIQTLNNIADQTILGAAKSKELVVEESVAHDFISEKMSAPVSLPKEKVNVVAEKKPEETVKPTYKADPYREPI
jgi:hypothetical protein